MAAYHLVRRTTAYQQQAHPPAAPTATFPAHDHGANLLPPHDPSALIPHSGSSNHSGWGAAISAVHSGVNSAAQSGVQSATVEGGTVSPCAPASACASASEPGSNMSSQFPSCTPSQKPSQLPSKVAGLGLAAAIATGVGGGIGGGEGGSRGAGGGGAGVAVKVLEGGSSQGNREFQADVADRFIVEVMVWGFANAVFYHQPPNLSVVSTTNLQTCLPFPKTALPSPLPFPYSFFRSSLPFPSPITPSLAGGAAESTEVAPSGASGGGYYIVAGEQSAAHLPLGPLFLSSSPPSLLPLPTSNLIFHLLPLCLAGGAAESTQVDPPGASGGVLH
ncbi:unnamed protein product [Closterium sp. NIES-53]